MRLAQAPKSQAHQAQTRAHRADRADRADRAGARQKQMRSFERRGPVSQRASLGFSTAVRGSMVRRFTVRFDCTFPKVLGRAAEPSESQPQMNVSVRAPRHFSRRPKRAAPSKAAPAEALRSIEIAALPCLSH